MRNLITVIIILVIIVVIGIFLKNRNSKEDNKITVKDANIQYVSMNDIEKIMNENKALGSMMSGSGPTVFGIYKNIEDALKGKKELLKKYKQVYVVNSNEKGVEING